MSVTKNNTGNFFTRRIQKLFGVDPVRQRLSRKDEPTDADRFNVNNIMGAYKKYLNSNIIDLNILYTQYDTQDMGSSDASNALDIIAEESTIWDKHRNTCIWVSGNNQTIVNKLNTLINRLGLDKGAYDYCRRIAKYGRWVVRPRYIVNSINGVQKSSIGWLDDQLSLTIPESEKYYRTIIPAITMDGEWLGFNQSTAIQLQASNTANEATFKYWDFIEFKIGKTIQGESILSNTLTTWRSLDALEQALDMFRLTKSPQLNIYKVPVGLSDPAESINIMKLYKKMLEKFSNTGGESGAVYQQETYAVPSPLQSIFFPVNNSGTTGDVNVVSNTADVNNIADVEYKRNKYISALYSLVDAQAIDSISDPSKPLSATSIRILRKVMKVQQAFMEGLDRLCQIELSLQDVDIQPDDYKIHMILPSDIIETTKLEKLQFAGTVAETLFTMGESIGVDDKQLWKEFIVKDFLGDYYGDLVERFDQFEKDAKDAVVPTKSDIKESKKREPNIHTYNIRTYDTKYESIQIIKDPEKLTE